ncbi:HPr kinase/phosphorylase [Brevundimonas sp.]|uniref:HPr kinase/phosphorylase n=1 Tax=Brevundimonas sp. TaxID=1871086 RepID=UPI002737940B|nr:HPr kinase/phosphatase C-terminal domain-containing protein [Brevundimonas sp.]MDP3802643.1 HPr kinase/phosphatase C-terminal domain-containing protein [Brevundimonas sp.]
MTDAAPVHATAAAHWTPGAGWRAVVISGPSGAGKSDLALRLIGRGWRLVADDYVHVFASGGALYATAPAAIAGRIEARGLGIVGAASTGVVRLVLAVELTAAATDRLPEPGTRSFAGRSLPLLRLNGFEPSAVEKVAAAIAPL